MSLVIGLTGMTGAGKSTVARYLEEKGARIVDADKVAREAILDKNVMSSLCDIFGTDILDENGSIVRRRLAVKAFADTESAKLLSSVTHPFILETCHSLINEYKALGAEIIILDAPLLYQSGADAMCDKVAFVTADRQIQLKRIIERDELSEAEATARLNVQKDMAQYEKRADLVIINNGDIHELYKQCDMIFEL